MVQKNIVRGQRVTPEKVQLAKEFRRKMTETETILWQRLRAKRLGGWHFRRQQILFGYIVDFYCHAASLVIEVDGEIHRDQREADRERDSALEGRGFIIIRFRNNEIEHNLESVLQKILAACNQSLAVHPNSPPLPGEGPGERSKGVVP